VTGLGEVLETARRASGLTQAQLAEMAEMSQAELSRFENEIREPKAEQLDRLARSLGVTAHLLQHAGRARGSMAMDAHMRRRQTAGPGVWRRVEARLNLYRWHTSHLFEEVTMNAEHSVPTMDLLDVFPEDAARMVRAQWRMPAGPVRRLVAWLEAAGCVVIAEDFGSSRVDGVSQWVGDHPVIMFNTVMPPDRVRLTLAHELGHLVLHSDALGVDDVEAQANAFAGEFLMPSEFVRPLLRNVKPARLLDLKVEYGVSMQALVERAFHLGLLSAAQRTSMYKMLSARGWRRHEPRSGDIPVEQPTLPAVIAERLAARGLSPDEVATIAGFAGASHNQLFRVPGLRAV